LALAFLIARLAFAPFLALAGAVLGGEADPDFGFVAAHAGHYKKRHAQNKNNGLDCSFHANLLFFGGLF